MPEQIAPVLALIGFGEAAAVFAAAGGWGASASGWDTSLVRERAMIEHGVRPGASAADALSGATLVLSLVTADQALEAAEAYAPHLAESALWCDMNSVAPGTKRQAARAIEAAGGRYVDVAVLAPVEPGRLAVPLLLAGPLADAAEAALRDIGFTNLSIVGAEVGKASAVKMIRSVMVKGLEALTDEMIQAARAAGVEQEVLTSLDASEKSLPWAEKAAYNLERMAIHGLRRAAEMEESAKTLISLGVDPVMTQGTVLRQRRAGEAK